MPRGALSWLLSVQLRCSAPADDRGLVPFQSGGPANYLASAQAALGLTTTLPARVRGTTRDSLSCCNGSQVGSVSTRNALLWGSARALRAGGGAVPNQFGSGSDLTATALPLPAYRHPGRPATADRRGREWGHTDAAKE